MFHYRSPDGEENYPGNLDLYVTFTLNGGTIDQDYRATTDKDTIVNIANHSYFNLAGKPDYIGDQVLQIKANQYAGVDPNCPVDRTSNDGTGTPFDFRTPVKIGDQLAKEANNQQMQNGKGFDHPFVLTGEKDPISLYCPATGIKMVMNTDLPYLQFYSGNFMNGSVSSYDNQPLNYRTGIVLETEQMPDDINWFGGKGTILRVGDTYSSHTSYAFSNAA